jgi:multidrug efflux system membrane fusion protein
VPPTAVQRGPQGLFAWVISGTSTAEPRPIEVGTTTKELAVITSGLRDGERVVTDGQYKLKRGAPVSFTSPPVAKADSAT